MAKYARIVGGVAVDVTATNPTELFHEDIAAEFVTVPNTVQNGWIKTGNTWAAPPTPEPAAVPTVYPKIGPIHFQMLFTPDELVAADIIRKTDAKLASFWKLVDDPRTDVIDLGLVMVQNAVHYTLIKIHESGVSMNVNERLAEVLSAKLD